MKTSFKPALNVALIIALAMLAHARTSSAQSADKPAAENPAADKPAADKPAADKPAADKPAADKPAADKPAADADAAPARPADATAGTPPSEPSEPSEPSRPSKNDQPQRDAAEPASSDRSDDKAEPRSADEHLVRGLSHYKAREFEKAIKAFHAGYKVDPRPEFLFALGQAERRSGDCISALTYYRRFIDTEPPARQVHAARMHMRSCDRALVSGPVLRKQRREGAPERATGGAADRAHKAAPARNGRAAVVATLPPAPQPSPWYHDTAGGVLLSTGTVAVLAGAGFMVASGAAQDRATWAATYPEYDLDIARARRYRLWGAAAMGAGTVLVAGAIYRYHSRSRRRSSEAREIGISPSSGGLTISYGGSF